MKPGDADDKAGSVAGARRAGNSPPPAGRILTVVVALRLVPVDIGLSLRRGGVRRSGVDSMAKRGETRDDGAIVGALQPGEVGSF